jgi:hypothetical protein
MRDDEFENLLDEYLTPPVEQNPDMAGVSIVWIRGTPDYGSRHIRERHGVEEQEVEEVLLQVPPFVEARKHSEHPGRTLFWGATRRDRWLLVVCEDWTDGSTRFLKPITAFEPDEGEEYWRRQ